MEYDPYSDDSITKDGFTLKFIHDPHQHGNGPHDNCDGFIPFWSKHLRHGGYDLNDEYDSYGIGDVANYFSDGQLHYHWKSILKIVSEYDVGNALTGDREHAEHWLDNEARTRKEDWEYSLADARREALEEFLQMQSMEFDVLADLYGLLKITAVTGSTNGYSQGDYAEWIAVSLPEFNKFTGNKNGDSEESINAQMQEWAYWLWGDCFGYAIEDKNGDEIDSCWGFYGDPTDGDNHGRECGLDSLNHAIADAKLSRWAKLKELIAAKVPLHLRPEILENA